MKMYHKKKYHLKKKYRNLLITVFIVVIVIFIQNSNVLKPLYKSCKEKYLIKEYVLENENLKNKISKHVFNDSSITINNPEENIKDSDKYDSMFFIKNVKNDKPIIYLYNTHQTEKYFKDDSISYTPTILTATKYLNEKLNSNDLPTIMETQSISKVLSENNWKYGYSYKVSRMFIREAVSNNPSIKYLFDIHRDSGSHEYTTLCTDDKCYAKILFLVGLENPNYWENQLYAEKLSKMVNDRLNGLSKGILQKKGKNVNGIYNQDHSNRTMLIEVGGENNTIEEVYNTIDILSDVISKYIKEEINYGK